MTEAIAKLLDDGLLPQSKIRSETTKRLSADEYITIAPSLREEYEGDGWVVDRKLKRRLKMKRAKAHEVAFEDKVWATMARLNFTELNADRKFRLPYGSEPNQAQQIDVFAADDQVVLLIECKSSATVTTNAFKKDVEAIQGSRPGLLRNIQKVYPAHKIKFILATNNFGLTVDTQRRIEGADIIHMDEEAIDYFLTLANHLGIAARYQLLGSLFAGQKIPGIESSVPAIEGKMGGHTYYSFAIEPEKLLTLSYILHRNKANRLMMPTYQRLIKKARLRKVRQFVDDGGFFPNSVILNIERGKRKLRFDRAALQQGVAKLGVLHLPQTYRAAYVIDGQHRLYGFAGSPRASKELLPVVAFVDLPRSEQVKLFMQINENQQAVPKNLRNTLNADLLWDSDDLREQARALKLRVAQHLGEDKVSPLYGRVIIGENLRSARQCITIDSINLGLDRGNFIGVFTKSELKAAGTFYRGNNEATLSALTAFLDLCFQLLREGLPVQWDLGNAEGGFVFINNGIESLLRIFSDLVDHVVTQNKVTPNTLTLDDLFASVEPYLQDLVGFLDDQSAEEAHDFRRLYGTGGRTAYWRRLQGALHEMNPSFEPAGLLEYQTEQEKRFNLESFKMVMEIELYLKNDVRERLKSKFDAQWFKKGVPLKVQTEVTKLAVEKNHDRLPEDEVEPWDCLHLIDYQNVMSQKAEVWSELFRKRYTRPGDEHLSWRSASGWLVQLNRIRNDLDHTYTVSEEDYEYLLALTDWLIEGQNDNVL